MSDDNDTSRSQPKPPSRNRKPGKQRITKEKYDALLAAFRKHSDNFKAVSKECGVGWETARRAWNTGWADQASKPWALPIKDVVHKEQVEARAALNREREDLVKDHRIARQASLQQAIEEGFNDLVDSRKKQGKVIRAARDNSIAALIVSQKMLKAAVPLADLVVQDLGDPDLNVFERMRLMRQIIRFSHDAVEMSQIVEEMERKALGEPDTILEVQGGLNMSVDEAKDTLKEVAEVLGAFQAGDDIANIIDAEWSDRDQLAVPAGKTSTPDGGSDDNVPKMQRDGESPVGGST